MALRVYKRKVLEMVLVTDSKVSDTQIPARVAQAINDRSESITAYALHIGSTRLIAILCLWKWFGYRSGSLIVNTQHFKSAILGWIVLCKVFREERRQGRVLVVHTLNSDVTRAKGILKPLIRRTYQDCECIIGVSKSVLRNAVGHPRQAVIYNCISRQDMSVMSSICREKRKQREGELKCIKIAWIGRLESVKRPIDLVNALASIESGGKEIKVMLAGAGRELKKLEERREDIKDILAARGVDLEVIGFVSRGKALEIQAQTNIYVNTSCSETFSVSTAEAAVDGEKILVLPDIECMNELYKSSRTVLFKSGNVKDLVRALNEGILLARNYVSDEEHANFIRTLVGEDRLVTSYEQLCQGLIRKTEQTCVEVTGQAGSGKSTGLELMRQRSGSELKIYDCVKGWQGKLTGPRCAGPYALAYVVLAPLLPILFIASMVITQGRSMRNIAVGTVGVYLKILGVIGFRRLARRMKVHKLVWDEGLIHIPFNFLPVRGCFLGRFLGLVDAWIQMAVYISNDSEVWVYDCGEETLRKRRRDRRGARETHLKEGDLDEFYRQGRLVSAQIEKALKSQGFKGRQK